MKSIVINLLLFLFVVSYIPGCNQKPEFRISDNEKNGSQEVFETYRPRNSSKVDDDQVVREITADSKFDAVNLNLCDNVTDKSVAHIAKTLPGLRKLYLSSPKITDEAFKHIAKLKKLEALSIAKADCTKDGVALIRDLTQLKSLSLYNKSLDSKITESLKNLTNLEELSGDFLRVLDDDGLINLGGMTKMRTLSFGSSKAKFTDKGLASIGKMTDLERLRVEGKQITDKGVASLSALTKLKELTLYGTNGITDKGVAHLGSLKSLEDLQILYGNSRIDGPGLESLKSLKSLKSFSCRRLGNKGMKYIGKIKQLEELSLSECRDIDDEGMASIADLTNLKELSISYTSVSDKGLVHLRGLKKLETLYTDRSKVTEKGRKELKSHLPELKD